MRNLKWHWIALAALFASQASIAATINVTTALDEFNCNSATCGVNTNVHGMGCSLREAMYNVTQGNNASFPECTPAPTNGGPNTIDLQSLDIQINGAVDDPNTVSGTPQIHKGSLEGNANVVSVASQGKLTIQNGKMSCFTAAAIPPNVPRIGARMFHVNNSGDLTLTNVTMHDCEDNELGIAVRTDANANLTVNNSAFTNIHSTDGDGGGCISHSTGSLTISDSAFTNCQIDDSQQESGAHDASGGAIAIGGVQLPALVQIYNTAFTSNTAKTNGGAMVLNGTKNIVIVNGAFTLNKANGDTFNSGNAELGGGAIYASGTETFNQVTDSFLIVNSLFTLNQAPDGTGGAILVTGGNLTYGASLTAAPGAIGLPGPPFNAPPTTPPYPTNVPGGIFSTNFLNNSAGGKWNGAPVDSRAGAGGAIFAHGNVAVLDSSFLSNSSSNGSGGGISLYGPSGSSTSLSVGNTTFNGNSANVNGGAIANLRNAADSFNSTMTLTSNTLSGNSAAASGGGAIYNGGAQADVVVSNTILASSSAGGNCGGPSGITDQASNLQFGSGTDCGAGMTVGDPMLAAALPFGGVNFQVAVMKLNPGSLASGTGDTATCMGQPVYNLDAALNTRPSGAPNCDIGAFESGNAPVYASTPVPGSTINIAALTTMPMTATVDISNTGSDNLIISNFSTTGGPQISVSGAATPFTIPVGNSTQTLTLTCADAVASNTSGTLTVTHNAAGSPATYPVNCNVTVPATPLSITTTSPLPQGTVGSAYSQTFAATGGMPPYTNWAITAGAIPAWATLDPITGMLTGTPPGTIGSPYTFTVQVTDSALATATKQFMLTVVAPPLSITTASPLPQALVGNAYSQTFAAMGGVPPYANWIVTAGTAPAWATLNSATGALTGMPPNTAGSPFTFTVQVTDSEAVTTTKQFMLTVAPPPLAITTASPLPNAMVAVAYNQMFAASGGTPPYTNWAITGGTAPGWATLTAATGAFAGTPPNTAGSPFTFTLTVTDSAMATANKQFMLQVLPPALVITTASPLPNATVGSAYSQTFAAAGGTPPYVSWTVVGGALPAWATLNAATGALTGTPPDTTGSPFSFTIQVTDTAAATTSKMFTLTVAPITPVRLQSFSVD